MAKLKTATYEYCEGVKENGIQSDNSPTILKKVKNELNLEMKLDKKILRRLSIDVKFLETDSGNINHAAAYYSITLTGETRDIAIAQKAIDTYFETF